MKLNYLGGEVLPKPVKNRVLSFFAATGRAAQCKSCQDRPALVDKDRGTPEKFSPADIGRFSYHHRISLCPPIAV